MVGAVGDWKLDTNLGTYLTAISFKELEMSTARHADNLINVR